MPHEDPPFRRDQPEDLPPSHADRLRVASFAMGPDMDEDDEYEDEGEVVDAALSQWLTRVINRHA
jgi:hypothetical protein